MVPFLVYQRILCNKPNPSLTKDDYEISCYLWGKKRQEKKMLPIDRLWAF